MEANDFLKFLTFSQKLKSTLRHSWTEDKTRQESSAEHSWHMAIMAMVLFPKLKRKVNMLKVLKLIAVHDLGEAVMGDIPAFRKGVKNKAVRERKAMEKIVKSLDAKTKAEMLSLWDEYEKKKTRDAKFVKMLDALDVLFQHQVADISTWAPEEFTFNLNRMSEEYYREEPAVYEIYNEVNRRLVRKVKKAS